MYAFKRLMPYSIICNIYLLDDMFFLCLISRRVSKNSEGGGDPKSSPPFFLAFQFSGGGGGLAQKIDEKMIFSTKKVAKYR